MLHPRLSRELSERRHQLRPQRAYSDQYQQLRFLQSPQAVGWKILRRQCRLAWWALDCRLPPSRHPLAKRSFHRLRGLQGPLCRRRSLWCCLLMTMGPIRRHRRLQQASS